MRNFEGRQDGCASWALDDDRVWGDVCGGLRVIEIDGDLILGRLWVVRFVVDEDGMGRWWKIIMIEDVWMCTGT